jgi:peptidyl-prolyl cis-trans isomerase B (cyclophilin B)
VSRRLACVAVAFASSIQVYGDITADRVYLAAERLMIERTYPPRPGPATVSPDELILAAAESHGVWYVRQAAVRAIGRFENPVDVIRIGRHLGDLDGRVRQETAHALVQALINAKPVEDAQHIGMAFDLLKARLVFETPGQAIHGGILECLAELPLSGPQAAELERMLLERIRPSTPDRAALRGIRTWYRRHADRPVSTEMRNRLRQLSVRRPVEAETEPFLAAIETLQAISDTDDRTITMAANYSCPGAPPGCGGEIRRVAVRMMSGAADRFGEHLYSRLNDLSDGVRLEAVRAVAKSIPSTRSCAPVIGALSDKSRLVVMTAIELLDPQCDDREEALARVRAWAVELGKGDEKEWHERTRALVTLARFAPEEALRITTEMAVPHNVWQVRAAAARVAALTRTESLALDLLKDAEPNVRTAALTALTTMGSDSRLPAAIDQLETDDYQLLLTAAEILKKERLGPLASSGVDATVVSRLTDALKRLTAADREPSRVVRVELLARLAEWASPSDLDLQSLLRGHLIDVDPFVAAAAADTLGVMTGTRPAPDPTRRPLEQPSVDELQNMRKAIAGGASSVALCLSDGTTIRVVLDPDDAPLTAARFLQRVRDKYYNGLTFHRVVPEVEAAGGSPGANDYSGYRRFWPDEVSPVSDGTGWMGLWAPGRHLGAGQFFITTSHDTPRHRFTFFGRAPGAASVMEGAVIREVTVGRSMRPCQ